MTATRELARKALAEEMNGIQTLAHACQFSFQIGDLLLHDLHALVTGMAAYY